MRERTQEIIKAQEQLVVQEKLASLGALTAGIAHEIKNPLNFVNNLSEITVELAGELRDEIARFKKKLNESELEEVNEIISDIQESAGQVSHNGKRADSIVQSMMQHSHIQSGEREMTDINNLLEEAANLAYHGMRAQISSFNVTIQRDYDASAGQVRIVPQDISRVFLNIINNACYAVHEYSQTRNDDYSPMIAVSTKALESQVEIRIRDNGPGIPEEIRDKIFNPFFTTKPTGKGNTGLGLSISYDLVVQKHEGELTIESEPGKFTEFVIHLPKTV